MTNLKKYGLRLLITLISILLFTTIITTLYYFNLINPTTYNILKIVFLLAILLINSFILGKNAKSKGYLEGMKLSLLLIIIFTVITLLNSSFELKVLLYYLIILITSVLGGMIGISKKREL